MSLQGRRTWPLVAVALVLLGAAMQLHAQGRLWWCACGRLLFWVSDAWSSENSQHLFDPYSFTHVLHGVVLYGLLSWTLPKLSPLLRLCFAITIEAIWEVVENSALVIDRYREATAALGYQGDTVVNSLGDIAACGTGVAIARYLGLRRSIAVFILVEIVLLLWIRDSLLLNVIMLIHPVEAIRTWQAGH